MKSHIKMTAVLLRLPRLLPRLLSARAAAVPPPTPLSAPAPAAAAPPPPRRPATNCRLLRPIATFAFFPLKFERVLSRVTVMFAILVKAHHTILVSPLESLHADWQQYGSGAVGELAPAPNHFSPWDSPHETLMTLLRN
jgi:hypothetical protein